MRKSVSAAAFILIIMSVWLASFWTTRARAIANWQENNPAWMQDVPTEIVDSEQNFRQWVAKNTHALQQQRLELCRLLKDPQTTDLAIREQAETIALTHEELLRAVAQHVVSMRSELPDSHKALLSSFCINTLRRGGCGKQQNRPEHAGEGHGNGLQRKRWRRKQYCALTRKLHLTEEQLTIANENFPGFDASVFLLQAQLEQAQQSLLSLLENQEPTAKQVTEQIDHIISVHNDLEKLLVHYVLIMREHLTAEQKSRLFGLCGRNCSKSQASEPASTGCSLNP